MRQFLLGHGSGDAVRPLVEECLANIGAIPARANLGFVYATDAVAAELGDVLALLKQRTRIAHWTGTVGVGINATGREYYEIPALAVMIASFSPSGFRPLPPQRLNIDEFIGDERTWLEQDPFHFGVLHADPTDPATPDLITELAARVPGAFFVGGLTSSQGRALQVADVVSSGGVSGVVFSSEVPVVTGHTQGCTPMGAGHVITACERNIAIELDGRPALDVLKEEAGDVLARDLARIGGYIFAGFPIPGSDTGDYTVRNLVGIDEEHKLIAIGEYLTPESEMRFCRRDGSSARADMRRMLVDLKRRMGPQPRGAVYYSCLGRGRNQFGEDSAELKLIQAELGDVPLVGFFASGEIFHNRLYGYTGVLTVFC